MLSDPERDFCVPLSGWRDPAITPHVSADHPSMIRKLKRRRASVKFLDKSLTLKIA